MKFSEKKQNAVPSFSYIDIFFLLMAGLILSFGIGFLIETHRENQGESYQVYLSASVEKTMIQTLPISGDVVFDEEGVPIGRVLDVFTEESGERMILNLKCRLDIEMPSVGEEMRVETPGSIRMMRVVSVESTEQKQEGR